jgi:8-oxo-dGTP diphosphatase
VENYDDVLGFLKKDKLKNISIINFLQNNQILSIECIDSAVLVRGISDRTWVYISCTGSKELRKLISRLNANDRCFAAIEEWMRPALLENKKLFWDLPLSKFYLPKNARLPDPDHQTINLSEADAGTVYENSEYKEYITVDYIKERIQKGISRGLVENEKFVAWGLTQDDSAIGFLHVLNEVRRKGYGLSITLALVKDILQTGELPFCYIEKDNFKSINMVSKLGFVKHSNCHWFETK